MSDHAERSFKCIDHYALVTTYSYYIFAPLFGIASLLTFLVIVRFITAQICQNMKLSKSSFFGALLLFICVFAELISYGMFLALQCRPSYSSLQVIFTNLMGLFFVAVYCILTALWYGRLYSIFKNTAWALTRTNHVLFCTVYCIGVTLGVSVVLVGSTKQQNWMVVITGIMLSIIALLTFMLLLWLMFSFVKKLFAVYKSTEKACSNDESGLNAVITKSSLLVIISLSLSLLSFISTILYGWTLTPYSGIFVNLMWLLDGISNVFCMLFTFKHFDGYYDKVCGTCNAKWSSACSRCSSNNDENIMVDIASSLATTKEAGCRKDTALDLNVSDECKK